MFEIVVLSGKGGAGKTSITGALASLAGVCVIADLDVDAPDLHILLQPRVEQEHVFVSGHEARIDRDECLVCGTCMEECRFGAISYGPEGYAVNPLLCEGCKVCVAMCPVQAMQFDEKECGVWFESRTRFGDMIHARLHPGEENSGKLVSLLKQEARDKAQALGAELILADGAPGIGCPVISSMSGVDLALMVTEPTPSGLHDLERVMDLAAHFRISGAVIINKFDLNPDYCRRIDDLCLERNIPVVGRLPLDPVVTRAMCELKVVTEYDNGPFARELASIWRELSGICARAAA